MCDCLSFCLYKAIQGIYYTYWSYESFHLLFRGFKIDKGLDTPSPQGEKPTPKKNNPPREFLLFISNKEKYDS